MLVKLLKHIEEGNGIKLVKRRGRTAVAFVQGAVIEVSDATGKKYIERGDAEKYIEPTPEVEKEDSSS